MHNISTTQQRKTHVATCSLSVYSLFQRFPWESRKCWVTVRRWFSSLPLQTNGHSRFLFSLSFNYYTKHDHAVFVAFLLEANIYPKTPPPQTLSLLSFFFFFFAEPDRWSKGLDGFDWQGNGKTRPTTTTAAATTTTTTSAEMSALWFIKHKVLLLQQL